jgi:hypothetical protein
MEEESRLEEDIGSLADKAVKMLEFGISSMAARFREGGGKGNRARALCCKACKN